MQGNINQWKREGSSDAEKIPRDPNSSRSQSYRENSPTQGHSWQTVQLQDHGGNSETPCKKIWSIVENV